MLRLGNVGLSLLLLCVSTCGVAGPVGAQSDAQGRCEQRWKTVRATARDAHDQGRYSESWKGFRAAAMGLVRCASGDPEELGIMGNESASLFQDAAFDAGKARGSGGYHPACDVLDEGIAFVRRTTYSYRDKMASPTRAQLEAQVNVLAEFRRLHCQ